MKVTRSEADTLARKGSGGMAIGAHTSKIYEQEARQLREKILLMGSLVEDMIANGEAALRTRDTALAQSTIRSTGESTGSSAKWMSCRCASSPRASP